MKALLLGHSYIRDLKSFVKSRHLQTVKLPDGNNLHLHFSFVPGATFATYLNQPELLDESVYLNPDIVVAVLGGNDISCNVDLSIVKNNCYHFFKLLKSKFPAAYVIGTQIESRFVEPGDRYEYFGTPYSEDFSRLSVYFNSWLNKQKFKDRLVCIRGPNKLDSKSFYRDSVHLNNLGLEKFFSLIENCLIDTCINFLTK